MSRVDLGARSGLHPDHIGRLERGTLKGEVYRDLERHHEHRALAHRLEAAHAATGRLHVGGSFTKVGDTTQTYYARLS